MTDIDLSKVRRTPRPKEPMACSDYASYTDYLTAWEQWRKFQDRRGKQTEPPEAPKQRPDQTYCGYLDDYGNFQQAWSRWRDTGQRARLRRERQKAEREAQRKAWEEARHSISPSDLIEEAATEAEAETEAESSIVELTPAEIAALPVEERFAYLKACRAEVARRRADKRRRTMKARKAAAKSKREPYLSTDERGREVMKVPLSDGVKEALIDVYAYNRLKADGVSFNWHWSESGNGYGYVKVNTPKPKPQSVLVHRLIVEAGKRDMIRFTSDDRLDLRLSNLKLIPRVPGGQNSRNGKVA